MERELLNALLENDLLLRDGMCLMEMEFPASAKWPGRFKKKSPGIENTVLAHEPTPSSRNSGNRKKKAQMKMHKKYSEFYNKDNPRKQEFRGGTSTDAPKPEAPKKAPEPEKIKVETKEKPKTEGIHDQGKINGGASGKSGGAEPTRDPSKQKGKVRKFIDGAWKWVKDTISGEVGNPKAKNRAERRLEKAGAKAGEAAKGGNILSHAASAAAGGLVGGHLAKKHAISKAWEYGVPAAAGVGALGYLAGRSSKDDR